jgi:hypothetical protein
MQRHYPRQAPVNERLLQCIWQDRMYAADRLCSVHGQAITVIRPGTWNCEAGPDFTGALIQVGNDSPLMGDVEIHICPTGWFQHRHHLDDLYRRVILHVALKDDGQVPIYHLASNSAPITQAGLEPALQWEIEELARTIDLWAYPYGRPRAPVPCRNILTGMPAPERQAFLEAAGMARFEKKIQRLAAWIGPFGWPDAILRALFDTLGYRKNRQQMRLLFDLRNGLEIDKPVREQEEIAIEFGLAGLLPSSLPALPDAADLARGYHRICWEYGIVPASPPIEWSRQNVRPANSPMRRIAAAALLFHIFSTFWDRFQEEILGLALDAPARAPTVPNLQDPFWNHRSDWDANPCVRRMALVGSGRWLEMLGNVLLPAVALNADIEGLDTLGIAARRCFQSLPPAAANKRLKEALNRLLPPGRLPCRPGPSSFIEQQGLLEIFMDTCLQARVPCEDCRLNTLLEQWDGPGE